MDESLINSMTAWALNRIEFLKYNCGIPISDISRKVGISTLRLTNFIKHEDGCNLNEQELVHLNKELDKWFRHK